MFDELQQPDSIDSSIGEVGKILDSTKEKSLSLEGINSQINFLLGEVLTVVDASIVDQVQRKAIKDLLKEKFYRRLDWIATLTSEAEVCLVGDPCVVKVAKGKKIKA